MLTGTIVPIFTKGLRGYSMKTKVAKNNIVLIIAILSFAIVVNIVIATDWYQALMVALS